MPPEDHLTAQGVTAALILAATQQDPLQAPDTYRQIMKQGVELAEGQIELPDQA